MKPKHMSIKEFRELGLLQEINRLFLHPMGLALATINDSGKERLSGVWDYRDDPEGLRFEEGIICKDKADRVKALFESKRAEREKTLGSHIQEIK